MSFRELLIVLLWAPAVASAIEPAVKLKDVALGGQRYQVVATIEGPALPVTITLEPGPDYENCAPTVPLPLTRLATKAGELVLVELSPAEASKKWRCAWRYKTAFGDSSRAAPEDCRLALPFRPLGRFRVIQGFDGALTHRDRVRHALDFAMPEGTPVLAARDGVVTWVQDDAQDGTRVGGNTVSLLHADGTLTQYAHLKRGSVVAVEGQSLSRGAVLALSGATNDTPVEPHLHFEVFLEPGTTRRTLPFKLSLPGGACRTPAEGESF